MKPLTPAKQYLRHTWVKVLIFVLFNGSLVALTLHQLGKREQRGYGNGVMWQLQEVKRMCDSPLPLLLDNTMYRCVKIGTVGETK